MKIILWVQSLDNKAPDIIIENGDEIDPSNQRKRQEIVSSINSIASDKTKQKEFSDREVTIYYSYPSNSCPKIVIKAITSELDNENRLTPIVNYIEFSDDSFINDKNLGDNILTNIEEIMNSKINRTFALKTKNKISDGLTELTKKIAEKKKIESEIIPRLIEIAIFIVILPITIEWIFLNCLNLPIILKLLAQYHLKVEISKGIIALFLAINNLVILLTNHLIKKN